MKKIISNISAAIVSGAFHQNEGVIIVTDDTQYTFVPLTHLGDDDSGGQFCSGTATMIVDGQFTNQQFTSDLFLRNVGTPDAYAEIDFI